MAWHVRGVVLPDDEVRDLWFVGDRVTLEPVPDAVTLADGGFVLPGLVDAHCHLGIRPGGAPDQSLDEARELAVVDRDAGVLAHPGRRLAVPVPELDDDPEVPRLARAGRHVAPPRRYLRDVGVEVTARRGGRRRSTAQAAAGNGWVKLVGDWIDRDVGDLAPAWDAGRVGRRRSRPRTPPGPGWPCTRSPRSRWRRWSGPAWTRSSTAPDCPKRTSPRWPGAGPRWYRR